MGQSCATAASRLSLLFAAHPECCNPRPTPSPTSCQADLAMHSPNPNAVPPFTPTPSFPFPSLPHLPSPPHTPPPPPVPHAAAVTAAKRESISPSPTPFYLLIWACGAAPLSHSRSAILKQPAGTGTRKMQQLGRHRHQWPQFYFIGSLASQGTFPLIAVCPAPFSSDLHPFVPQPRPPSRFRSILIVDHL